jgi:hypothetical protein
MKPYWIKIAGKLGVGITAYSADDAQLIFFQAFGDAREIESIEQIADMRDIEPNHVAPNMGNWFRRGVWFPIGYEQISN